GMLKIEHIRAMLQMERIGKLWEEKYGRTADNADIQAIYGQFEPKLLNILDRYSAPKPFVLDAVEKLRRMGLKIGSTTGYTDKMMEIVVPEAAKQGYAPDCWFSPDSVGGKGRPCPYMIFRNMQKLQISSVRDVVKVGDTVADIKEGVNAGVWSVGVIEGSSELGLSEGEWEALSGDGKKSAAKRAETSFRNAGAHFVIQNLAELPALISMLGI
ncbi:MAG: phosphonoacetaldehyde hydrolase, partial [Eubacteriales bacterium]|nr:phosphonoacetaldehyde hydrolase [Eubacteriales bacterium]